MELSADWLWWTLACLAVVLIGITKSGFGSGVGLMIVPMMAIAMDHIPGRGSEAALGLLLPLLVFGDLLAVWQYRKMFWPGKKRASVNQRDSRDDAVGSDEAPGHESRSHEARDLDARGDEPKGTDDDVPEQTLVAVEVGSAATPEARSPRSLRQKSPGAGIAVESSAAAGSLHPALIVLRRLLPGTAIGVILGGLLLWWLHHQAEIVGSLMRIEIGLESVILVSLHWWRQYNGVQQRLMAEPFRSYLTGGFSAISSTLAHAAGPIIAMYLLPLRLDRQTFVGACAIYFFLLNTAKLPVYAQAGQFKRAELSFTIKFVPLVIVGALAGLWLNKRLSDRIFSRFVYFITFALGWYMLGDGARQLFAHFRA
jgi:hypothetical protein